MKLTSVYYPRLRKPFLYIGEQHAFFPTSDSPQPAVKSVGRHSQQEVVSPDARVIQGNTFDCHFASTDCLRMGIHKVFEYEFQRNCVALVTPFLSHLDVIQNNPSYSG